MDIGIGQAVSFLDVVKRIYKSWPAYQLAIQHRTGGSDTLAKDEWLAEETAAYLSTVKDLDWETLADWIDSIFNEEFNLVAEDGSSEEFAKLFLRAADHVAKQNMTELAALWNAIPQKPTVNVQKQAGEEDSSDDDDGDDDDDEDEPMEEDDAPEKPKKGPRFVQQDDGWTSVVKR